MAQLTPRQQQIAKLLATGKTQRQIAHELGVKNGTVYAHTRNMRRLTGMHTSTIAINIAVKGASHV